MEILIHLKDQYDQKLKACSKKFVDDYLQFKYELTPEQIVRNYIIKTNQLCNQGGYGYSFSYANIENVWNQLTFTTSYCPNNWVVKPQYYDLAQPNLDQIIAINYYSSQNPKFTCILDTQAEYQFMSN